MTMMTQIPPTEPAPEAGQASVAQGVVESSKDARTWAMVTHLSALSGFIGVPLGWFLGPLVIWLIKKEQFPFVDRQGKEAMNWQLTVLIGIVISIPLSFICIGFVTLTLLGIADLVFTIIAAIKANDGIEYKYPWRIRFFK
jgi:uncharacterized Tic20 family protein